MDTPPIILPREVFYEWSPDLIKRATQRFVSRYARRSFIIAFILMAIGVIGLITGEYSGIYWFFVFLSIMLMLVWIRYYFHTTKIYKEMPDRHVKLSVAEDSITFQTSEHLSTIKWSLIKKVWKFPDVLLLFTYGHWNYMAIPVAPLGADLAGYIEDRVRKNGGKVI